MKVLFNGSMYSEKPTGVGIFIREIFAKLVHLKLLSDKSTLYVYSPDELPHNNAVKTIKLPTPLEAVFKRSLSLHRIIWNFFFLPIIARKYNLVYSFSSHGSPFIKNQIVTVHDLICMQFPAQHKTQYYYFKYLMPAILKSCIKVVTVSHYTKAEVIKHYKIAPEKITVISGAADHLQKATSFNIPEKEKAVMEWLFGKRFFLSVGASYEHKNIERLIVAMKLLNNDDLLVIVGSGNAYYSMLKEKYTDAQIHFLEYVSEPLLGYLYAHCIANVYVSLYEGMGFPPYEAAIYNTVTIASNATAIPEIYGDSVYYIDPLNTESIAAALKLFSESRIDKSSYQRHFPALLKKYSWENTARAIHNLIQKEVEKPSN